MEHELSGPCRLVGEAADSLGLPCYAVGGCVRDHILGRPCKDLDFVSVGPGSGIELAHQVARMSGRKEQAVTVFRNFGTARLMGPDGHELEFVGARRESYRADSRKPIVEDGTLEQDLSRRDFTVNALAVCLNAQGYGRLVDLFGGMEDMESRTLRTPLDPDVTFSDDPLRMMRAVRFATQLDFDIAPETLRSIRANAHRLEIISRERVADELMKIMKSPRPSTGWQLMRRTGLLKLILPQLDALKGVETVDGRGHKDNFEHTMRVLDNVARESEDVWLRWAALLHDIAKPVTKKWDKASGWTFRNHNFIGGKMVPAIFRSLKLPLGPEMKLVAKMVDMHMRPIGMDSDQVTDSAVRRLVFDAGDHLDHLMTLCEADVTSKNPEKVRRVLKAFALVRQKIDDLNQRDRIRNFQPPVTGQEIMATFALPPCQAVGTIKAAIKDAILDGVIGNDHDQARQFMLLKGRELGLEPVAEADT